MQSDGGSSDSRADDSANKLIEQFYKEDYLRYKQAVKIPKEAAVAVDVSFKRLERNLAKNGGYSTLDKFRRKSTRRTISIGDSTSLSIKSASGMSFTSKTFERRKKLNSTNQLNLAAVISSVENPPTDPSTEITQLTLLGMNSTTTSAPVIKKKQTLS